MAQAPNENKTVAIIGTGMVGLALATGFSKLGYKVIIGSRSAIAKGTATDDKTESNKAALIKEYGLLTFSDAAKQGDIIVLSIKFEHIRGILDKIKGYCDNKLVIDTNNPLKNVEAKMPIVVNKDILGKDGSCGELIQNTLGDKANVVKCWNIVGSSYMCNPNPNGDTFLHDPIMMICGNNDNSKKEMTDILTKMGWKDILDCGNIDMSCHLESMCFLWCARGFMKGVWNHNWAQMVPKKKE